MSYVVTVTVPAGKVASTLTNFVTRVDLSHMPAAWWTDTTSDLGNVRVKAAGSVIPFDIVTYNRTAKTGELFFKASLTTGSNAFTVETVDGATALAVTDTNGRNAVWSDYAAAFVFGGGMADRAGKSGDATVRSGTLGTATTPGWLNINGSAVVQSLGVGFNTTFTMGASFIQSGTTGNNNLVSYGTDTTTSAHRESLCIENGANPALFNTTDSFFEIDGTEAATPNTVVGVRERLVGIKNGTTERYMVRNGVRGSATDTTTAARPASPGNAFYMGAGSLDTTSRFNGELNYAYLRFAVLSVDWLAAESASWETPASFYTVTDTGPASTTGTIAAVLPALSASIAGTYGPTATLTATLPTLGANLDGTAFPPGIAGDLTATLPPLGATLAGTYAETATLAATLPALSANLAGTVLPPPVTGTLTASLPALRATIAGQAFDPGTSGYLEAVLPALSAAFSGTVQGRSGLGLVLDSSAVLTVADVLDPEPTVPPGTPPTVLHIIAPTVPVPTLVAGRPQ